MNDNNSANHTHHHHNNEDSSSSSSSEDPLMHDDISFDEDETPVDDLDIWNPEDPSYAPPTEDAHKGALQMCMEDPTYIASNDLRSYIYMLVLSAFPDWNITHKTPYFENEAKELKDKKPREYQALKIVKRLLVKEIHRRDAGLGRNAKNKTISALFDELTPLTDPRDVLYLKYRERELRHTIRTFLQKRSEFERQKEAAAGAPVIDVGDAQRVPAAHRQQPNNRNEHAGTSRTPSTGRSTAAAPAAHSRLASPQPALNRGTASTTTAPDRNAVIMNNSLDRLLVEVGKMSQAMTRMADTMVALRQEARLVENEALHKDLASLKKERRELQIIWAREPDRAVKEALNGMIDEMKEEIAELSSKRQRVE